MTAPVRDPFRWPVRVYYEDTDAGGVVYYANYLKYLERTRTEWLSALGFPLIALQREHDTIFVVHRLEIEYRQPARLGDMLDVTLSLIERGRSRLVARQEVLRDAATLVSAHVTIACIDRRSWRPARIPALLAAKLTGKALEETA